MSSRLPEVWVVLLLVSTSSTSVSSLLDWESVDDDELGSRFSGCRGSSPCPLLEATGSRQRCFTRSSSALLSSEKLNEGSLLLSDADVKGSILEPGFLLMKLAMNLLKTIPLSANVCGERRPGTVLKDGLDPLSCPLLSPWK